MINLNLTKKQVEISGFLIFLFFYLLFFNMFFRSQDSEVPIYAPGALIFALFGYWLSGYLYDKVLK
jgi:hypothetical protein